MTTEEKAKAYDEALERAKNLHKDAIDTEENLLAKQCEIIFPELEESEDEKIRKALIRFHKSTIDVDGIKGDDILAWLEKQKSVREIVERCKNSWYNEGKIDGMAEGLTNDEKYQQGWHDALEKQDEQKPILDFKASNWYVSKVDGKIHDMTYNPTDKVKPKFKVGDMVCKKKDNSFCATINSITDTGYLCDVYDSDGDYDDDYAFLISEQDEYKLVAKKTEDEIEIPFGAKDSELQEETYFIPDGFHAEIDDDKVVIKKGEKPTEWSDEDENYLQSAENACEYQYGKNTSTILWLKSLKDRIGG